MDTPPPPPPAYDTLSLAPPSISAGADTEAGPSSSTQAARPSQRQQQQPAKNPKSLKDRWRDLKDEDERRKAERITHVSADEADRITGLDRHRAEEERKSAFAERPRGMKAVLGVLALN
ncbi:hypothetical protein OHC33_006485 [Knufia fluminis]|uniref:Uncharacterized protein n=1 Tax=Knufia fluminis TaxID=191047 RepID=A0AAN8I393_9EURO|nr:hypothetical protein OHC33_006485 [Knufia fluminis]